MSATWPAERIIDQRGSDQEHAEWLQLGWRRGYADAFQDIVRILYTDDAWDEVARRGRALAPDDDEGGQQPDR